MNDLNNDNFDLSEFIVNPLEQNFEEIELIPLTYELTIKGIENEFVVSNLTKNGTNYVSEIEIDTNQWPKIFELIVKSSDGSTEHYEYAKLVQQANYEWDNNKYYLSFNQIPKQDIENMKLKSDVEYIAMMTDVEV